MNSMNNIVKYFDGEMIKKKNLIYFSLEFFYFSLLEQEQKPLGVIAGCIFSSKHLRIISKTVVEYIASIKMAFAHFYNENRNFWTKNDNPALILFSIRTLNKKIMKKKKNLSKIIFQKIRSINWYSNNNMGESRKCYFCK